jgi:hypothetical protein
MECGTYQAVWKFGSARRVCLLSTHTINICASCLKYADSYGASQELLLEAMWKTQDRKIAKAVKYNKQVSL